MNGYGHLYIDAWFDDVNVYCRGMITEDYNVYGHKWSVQANIHNPGSTRSNSNLVQWYPATISDTVSLSLGGDAGDFSVGVVLRELCPYLGLLVLGSFAGDPVPAPRIIVSQNILYRQYEDPDTLKWHYAQITPCVVHCPVFSYDDFSNLGEYIMIERAYDSTTRRCADTVTVIPNTGQRGCSERPGP